MSLIDQVTPELLRRLARRLPRRSGLPGDRRFKGCRFECQRCGTLSRMPTHQLYYGTAPALCGSCVMDDLAYAQEHRPRVDVYAHREGVFEMRKWTDEGDLT
jgi:transcription elongation factor Elf1